jgi:hypothetical protein
MANTNAIRKVEGRVISLNISTEAVLDGKGTCALERGLFVLFL